MKALVTGAAGFVGRYLVDHLVAEGDEVVVTDRSNGGPDLLDPEGLTALLAEHRPEVVFHLAGQADVARSWTAPTETLRTNAEGTHHLLSAARTAGADRVVTVTSADVYGVVRPEDLPLDEAAPFRPASPYAASKAMADLVAQQAHLGHGQDVVRARSFNHFGPGQGDSGVCSALASRIATCESAGADTIAVGNLEARRDFTDVRDVVRAYRLLATKGQAGRAYNVCSGRAVAIAEVLEVLLSLSGRSIRPVDDPALHRPVDLPELRGDPRAIHNDTGWTPTINMTNTLKEVLEDRRLRPSAARTTD
ncbi:MAG TPA: GDP-mannose 4,6-dehydratase [Acidimicrobiaceae bacterium]|nr:GDP-mannose 4,6-dehydratase [Acidimicrobiaceae bacterium]